MSKEKFWGLKKEVASGVGKTLGMTVVTAMLLCNISFIEKSYASEDEAPLMDTVVVTATRQEEKISKIPANVTVISEQDIAQSVAATVPELLRSTPGILVNDITGNGRSVTIDLRGFGEAASANTLVLIDGRRINQTDLTNTDWTLIPKNRVQRIEIVRGSRGSVFYGDNAAGGVINIITKKGEEPTVTANIAVGSFSSLNSGAGVSGSTDKIGYALNANYFTSDGYRDNSETNAKDLGLNFDLFASDKVKIYMSGGYHEDETRLPGGIYASDFASGMIRTESSHPDDFSETKDFYFQAAPEIFITDNSYIKLETSVRTRQTDSFLSYSSGSSLYTTEIDTFAVSPHVVLNEEIFALTSKLIAGFDYSNNKLKIYNDAYSIYTGQSIKSAQLTKEDFGYYAHQEFHLTDKFIASGGTRYDRVKLSFPSNSSPEQEIIDEESYTLGLTYSFTPNLSTYTSYSTSFRYPLLDEMYSYYYNTVNTTLGPQTGDDYEAGFLFQIDSNTSIGINLFRIETENEIFYNIFAYANQNLDGDAVRQGVELTASKKISNLKLSGSYTYKDTEIEGGIYDGSEVPNVPNHQLTLGADLEPCSNVIINLNGTYVGERVSISDFANTYDEQDDFFNLSGKITYMLEKGSAFITVNNILNEKYSEFGSVGGWPYEEGFYPSPEINVMAGFNLEF